MCENNINLLRELKISTGLCRTSLNYLLGEIKEENKHRSTRMMSVDDLFSDIDKLRIQQEAKNYILNKRDIH